MLLVIPRRLKSQTSERAYIYGRDRRVPHRGKRRTPMEMLILCDSAAAAAPTPSLRPIRGYAIKPAIIVRTFSLERQRYAA